MLDPVSNVKLSANFTLSEATDSDTATRLGIDNSPSVYQLAALRGTAGYMEQVRAFLGHPIRPNSWLRVEALERVLCAKDYRAWCSRHGRPITEASWKLYFDGKAHPKGYAVDFTCPQFGTPAQIVDALRKSDIRFDQLIAEGTWVHISFAPAMRGMVMAATFLNGTPSYQET